METTIINNYNSITSIEDLNKNKITLAEYRTIGEIIKNKRALTCQYGVANWFKKQGAYVELQKDNINWLIQL